MKLIIDIEPRYCKYMYSDVKELYYEAINRITEAVRNGQPYEEKSHDYDKGFNAGYAEAIKNLPEYRELAAKFEQHQEKSSGDTISRSALKAKIPYLWSDPTDIGMLLDLIDSAPTV